MEDRLKKLSSQGFPLLVVAAVSIASAALIGGVAFGNPQAYAEAKLASFKPLFASLSDSIFASLNRLGGTPSSEQPPPDANQSAAPHSSGAPSETRGGAGIHIQSHPLAPPSRPGPPDLAIQIVDTGILDVNNAFSHATSVQPGQRGAVIFDVKNIGGSVSPEWIFSAKIPTPDADYTSRVQSPLAPGEGVRFTMAFSNLNQLGANAVSFTVDPDNRVLNDPNRSNNTASATLFRNY